MKKKWSHIFKPGNKISVESVKTYYEHWTGKYIESFGEVFQSKQAQTPEALALYLTQQLELKAGMKLLDAGCGIGGPAILLTQLTDVTIDAITLSPTQVEIGKKNISEKNLQQKVKIQLGDFHQMSNQFENGSYDVVYFLESLVHSADPHIPIAEAHKLLKPDGVIYIKDLYRKTPYSPAEEKDIEHWVRHNNENIKLNIIPKEDLLIMLRNQGFQLEFCQLMRIPTNQDLGNRFVTVNNIMPDPIANSLPPYLEWYEIKAIKPGPGLVNKM